MKFKKAFTLIELLIVVAITTIIAGVGVSSYVNQQRTKLLDTTAQEIVGYLRYVQQKSIGQEGGNQWGIHFENPDPGDDFYALYTFDSIDSNCATSSPPIETGYLPSGIEFSSPPSASSTNISFNKLTGTNCSGTSQFLVIQSTSSNATTTISVSGQGLISY